MRPAYLKQLEQTPLDTMRGNPPKRPADDDTKQGTGKRQRTGSDYFEDNIKILASKSNTDNVNPESPPRRPRVVCEQEQLRKVGQWTEAPKQGQKRQRTHHGKRTQSRSVSATPESPDELAPDVDLFKTTSAAPKPLGKSKAPYTSSSLVPKPALARGAPDPIRSDSDEDDMRNARKRAKTSDMVSSLGRRPVPDNRVAISKAVTRAGIWEDTGVSCFYELKSNTAIYIDAPSGFEWLKIGDVVHHVDISQDESCYIQIARPHSSACPSPLMLKFKTPDMTKRFVEALKRDVAVKTHSSEWMQKAFGRLENESHFSKPRYSPEGRAPTIIGPGRIAPEGLSSPTLLEKRSTSLIRNNMKTLLTDNDPSLDAPKFTRSTRSTNTYGQEHIRSRPRSPPRPSSAESWTRQNPGYRKRFGPRHLSFPPTGRDRQVVYVDDIEKLNEGAFLNDNIINFYLRYMMVHLEDEAVRQRVHVMSSFWFDTLSKSASRGINYSAVSGWTSKMDIFKFDYIVVPVNEHMHWYVAIIVNPGSILTHGPNASPAPRAAPTDEAREKAIGGRVESSPVDLDLELPRGPSSSQGNPIDQDAKVDTEPMEMAASDTSSPKAPPERIVEKDPILTKIVTLDSLHNSHSGTCSYIRDFLFKEAEVRHKLVAEKPRTMGMTAKTVPGQDNYHDCGVFLLAYIQRFLKDPDEFIATIRDKKSFDGWEIDTLEMRGTIRDIIFDLKEQQNEKESKNSTDKRNAQKPAVAKLPALKTANSSAVKRLPPTTQITERHLAPASRAASRSKSPLLSPLGLGIKSDPLNGDNLDSHFSPMIRVDAPPTVQDRPRMTIELDSSKDEHFDRHRLVAVSGQKGSRDDSDISITRISRVLPTNRLMGTSSDLRTAVPRSASISDKEESALAHKRLPSPIKRPLRREVADDGPRSATFIERDRPPSLGPRFRFERSPDASSSRETRPPRPETAQQALSSLRTQSKFVLNPATIPKKHRQSPSVASKSVVIDLDDEKDQKQAPQPKQPPSPQGISILEDSESDSVIETGFKRAKKTASGDATVDEPPQQPISAPDSAEPDKAPAQPEPDAPPTESDSATTRERIMQQLRNIWKK